MSNLSYTHTLLTLYQLHANDLATIINTQYAKEKRDEIIHLCALNMISDNDALILSIRITNLFIDMCNGDQINSSSDTEISVVGTSYTSDADTELVQYSDNDSY